jgi:hypothetical protein
MVGMYRVSQALQNGDLWPEKNTSVKNFLQPYRKLNYLTSAAEQFPAHPKGRLRLRVEEIYALAIRSAQIRLMDMAASGWQWLHRTNIALA